MGALPPPQRFAGAGIYALYYTGDFSGYRRIAEGNRRGRFNAPIYIGKAVPPGARKGGYGLGESPGEVLFRTLKEHAGSIEQSENLSLADFTCRDLVTDDIWIPLTEALLIEKFKPVWNRIVDGFGIHDPGGGRQQQEHSKWDTLHPGRPFAKQLRLNRQTLEQILAMLKADLPRK